MNGAALSEIQEFSFRHKKSMYLQNTMEACETNFRQPSPRDCSYGMTTHPLSLFPGPQNHLELFLFAYFLHSPIAV